MTTKLNTSEPEHNRIVWACRRGMLELDMFLLPFAEQVYPKLSSAEQAQFKNLLAMPDPQLFAWLMGHEQVTESEFVDIVKLIREHAKNK